jgi:hypothetical protein
MRWSVEEQGHLANAHRVLYINTMRFPLKVYKKTTEFHLIFQFKRG